MRNNEYPLKARHFTPLTPEQQKMKHKMETDSGLYKIYIAVYQTTKRNSSKYPNFYSMAQVFDHYDSLIWIDEAHITPVGNRVIAERILGIIQARSADEKDKAAPAPVAKKVADATDIPR
jgi:hypothetical protein